MNLSKLKSNFNYIIWPWILAPMFLDIDTGNYSVYIVKGVVVSAIIAVLFYGLDVLTNKLLKRHNN